ncbi:hypothetical protein BBK14_19315 [Parafrankia soli]|uniref:Amino acid permease n=1 Tax=Parafrankia soli TaxID=2599596 RepID=A0A1S1Q2H0_9ACTN|nr:hypothetical protein BBK14_19315 [Parafrankia soli]
MAATLTAVNYSGMRRVAWASAAPLTDAVRAAGVPGLAPVVRAGAAVTALVLTTDPRGAIGFSSFGVLLYYAVANAAAWTLSPTEGRPVRAVPVVGLLGCLLLAFSLPGTSVLGGSAVLAAAAVVYAARHAGGHPARQ